MLSMPPPSSSLSKYLQTHPEEEGVERIKQIDATLDRSERRALSTERIRDNNRENETAVHLAVKVDNEASLPSHTLVRETYTVAGITKTARIIPVVWNIDDRSRCLWLPISESCLHLVNTRRRKCTIIAAACLVVTAAMSWKSNVSIMTELSFPVKNTVITTSSSNSSKAYDAHSRDDGEDNKYDNNPTTDHWNSKNSSESSTHTNPAATEPYQAIQHPLQLGNVTPTTFVNDDPNQQQHEQNAQLAVRGNTTTMSDTVTTAAPTAPPKRPENKTLDPLINNNKSVSACLLIKDDNDILSEWIAYHYYALKLRYLIVAVDPHSLESPSFILDTWRNLTTDLRILEWTDSDYMPQSFLQTGRAPPEFIAVEPGLKLRARENNTSDVAESILAISNHRYRQRIFLAGCMKKLRDDSATWVIHIDTDEYVVPSKILRQMKPSDISIRSMDKPNAVFQLIQDVVRKNRKMVNYPCISMLRVLFGSVEDAVNGYQEERNNGIPPQFNATYFETLRWRHHALPHQDDLNPKVILDVSSIPAQYFPNNRSTVVFSIHRPFRKYCPARAKLNYTDFRRQPLTVNHYLGSWERYSKRSDVRRNRDIYDARAKFNESTEDGYIRPWLQGFNDFVGETAASELLLLGKDGGT